MCCAVLRKVPGELARSAAIECAIATMGLFTRMKAAGVCSTAIITPWPRTLLPWVHVTCVKTLPMPTGRQQPLASARQRRHRLATICAGLQRFVAPYYLSNVLLLASYFVTRAWFLHHGVPKYTHIRSIEALMEKAS